MLIKSKLELLGSRPLLKSIMGAFSCLLVAFGGGSTTTALTGDVEYLNKLYAAIDKLQPQDLSAFVKKTLVDSGRTTVTLSHGEGPKEPEAPAPPPKAGKAAPAPKAKTTKGGAK